MPKAQIAIVSGAVASVLIPAAVLASAIASDDPALIGPALLGLAILSVCILCTGLAGFGVLVHRRVKARSKRHALRRFLTEAHSYS